MFGLESSKKKKVAPEFFFELENELKDPKKSKEIKERVERRLQKIKERLRTGDDQLEYARFSLLLLGYTALQKVMTRVTAAKKK